MSLAWILSRLGIGRIQAGGGGWIPDFPSFAVNGTEVTASASAINSAAGEGTDIDAGASGTAGSVDIFPATAAKGKLRLVATDNTNNDAVTVTNEAHGQATSVKIPDMGLATTYVAQSTAALTAAEVDRLDGALISGPVANKAVLADANGIVRHKDAMDINMADGQLVLTANTGAPAGTLLTSDLLFVDANSTDTAEDLLLPPEADCIGMTLIIHNVGGENIAVKEDSDSTVLGLLAPDDLGIFFCNGTTWQGGTMKQNMTGVYRMNPWDMRNVSGDAVTSSDVAGTFNINVGGAASGLSLLGEVANGAPESETSVCKTRFQVPMNYIAGQSFIVRLLSALNGAGAVAATPTIDLTAKILAANGTLGADICATAAQNLAAGAPTNKDFTLTPTTITPGCIIELEITTVVENTNSTDVQSEINNLEMRCTVNN